MKTQRVLQIGSWAVSSILGGALLGACASSGTEPHAMTAGQHQAAAASEEQVAAGHQAQYNPSATAPPIKGPSPTAYSACISYESSNCYVRWRSEENPTDRHRAEAVQHKNLAEKHRAASKALIEAEERFCSGIPVADRDTSPFYHREDITAVQGLKIPTRNYGYSGDRSNVFELQQLDKEASGGLQGARITFRAVAGMTPEWLQRVVDCHLARNAVIDNDPSMSFCPLAVAHATASVMSTGNGFAVDVTSNNEASAREIIKRAGALGPNGLTAAK